MASRPASPVTESSVVSRWSSVIGFDTAASGPVGTPPSGLRTDDYRLTTQDSMTEGDELQCQPSRVVHPSPSTGTPPSDAHRFEFSGRLFAAANTFCTSLSLIHISEPTRLLSISYAVF